MENRDILLSPMFFCRHSTVVIGVLSRSGLPCHAARNANRLDSGDCPKELLFAGECETHLDDLIVDAACGRLRAIYDYTKMLPDIWTVGSPPFLPVDFAKRAVGNVTSLDPGRGCPFQCSFCAIINVRERRSRCRSPDSIEQIIRPNWAHRVDRCFITVDTFARNKDRQAIYDRIIECCAKTTDSTLAL